MNPILKMFATNSGLFIRAKKVQNEIHIQVIKNNTITDTVKLPENELISLKDLI